MYNPFTLTGKTLLVTGASSGIGRATAIECSRLGATLVITARNEERLRETFNSLDGEGHLMLIADVTKQEDVSRLVQAVPLLDGFVCNAGITKRRPISFIKEDDLREVFEINTISSILLTRALAKAKKFNKCASLVFTSSKAARIVTPGNSMYAASKAAIESFSRSCALEFASRGIRSNAILPGMVETPLIMNGALAPEDLEKDKEKYLLKRYGKPEDIALLISFLMSDASSWITATSIDISGGLGM
ncbi:MAG: SDR family oxidoreductase [Odoribacter sp.]|nr:SDR family oxidoreductase [Odoribacter sp.]